MRPLLLALLGLSTLAPRAGADELLVFAAASTSDAMTEAGRAFERAEGHRVQFDFAGSSTLARQILAGAPADLFLSADEEKMDRLERARLVERGERRDLLSNRLVVVVPSRGGRAIAGPDQLRGVARLALGDPASVPAGIYARAWLEKRGLWSALADRVVPMLDVRAALAAVAAGRVDAGIVYRTDALTTDAVRVVFEVPPAESPPIAYPLAPLARAPHRDAARAFARFLAGPGARAIFERHGFLVL